MGEAQPAPDRDHAEGGMTFEDGATAERAAVLRALKAEADDYRRAASDAAEAGDREKTGRMLSAESALRQVRAVIAARKALEP
jgi:hypothetical protein